MAPTRTPSIPDANTRASTYTHHSLLPDEPDLNPSEAPLTDSPAILRRTRNKSLSAEQKDVASERVPSRSLDPQGQQPEFRERGGLSELEFLRATSDLLNSELEQREIESHHLNLNLSQLEMEAQRQRKWGHQLLGVRVNDTEEERKLMRASLLEAAKLKKQLEEDLRDIQRDRDELEQQNRDLAKHNEVLEKRESEIEEEIQQEEQREVALYRERNSLAEATKKALLDKVILDQDIARLEQEKRKYRELTRGMARRVYELEARCRAKN